MAGVTPDLRLPSQPQAIAALWPVPRPREKRMASTIRRHWIGYNVKIVKISIKTRVLLLSYSVVFKLLLNAIVTGVSLHFIKLL